MKTHIAAEYAAPGLVISTYIKIRVICERAIPNSNGRLQPLFLKTIFNLNFVKPIMNLKNGFSFFRRENCFQAPFPNKP